MAPTVRPSRFRGNALTWVPLTGLSPTRKNRQERVGAVAEYMLAPLGVPAPGLSRTKGIVAWTGPSGY